MPPKKDGPWSKNWRHVEDLSHGGQGTTYIVVNEKSGDKAVLKVLKSNKKPKNRARMCQEVTNLKILHAAGCNVPYVLEDNTSKFEDVQGVPRLYFVMEMIEGRTLKDLVESRGALELGVAVRVAAALCDTVEKAFSARVLHRDIKPENIVVRSVEECDVVVLDYGLSFNSAEPRGLTDSDEPMGSAFFRKPEQTATSGNKHEERSDLADLVAVFYYCITAEPPGAPVDGSGNAPHRRETDSLKSIVNDMEQLRRLETFFDKGFQLIVDMRFQTPKELRSRLMSIMTPSVGNTSGDPVEVARRMTEFQMQHDSATRQKIYRRTAGYIVNQLKGTFGQINEKINQEVRGHPFGFGIVNAIAAIESLVEVKTLDGIVIKIELTALTPARRRGFAYQVAARGSECVVFCGDLVLCEKGRVIEEAGNWTEIFACDGMMESPNCTEVLQHMKCYITERMEELLRQSHQRQSQYGSNLEGN